MRPRRSFPGRSHLNDGRTRTRPDPLNQTKRYVGHEPGRPGPQSHGGSRVPPSDVNQSHVTPAGAVLSRCWCDRASVYVTPDDVYHGRTLSCGRPTCKAPS